MTSIAFATPSLNHDLCFEYFGSMVGVIAESIKAGIKVQWLTRGGDQFIAKARSRLVEDFLASSAENLFFVDSDVGFPAEKVIEFINRPEPVIAGVYPKKQETPDWPVSLLGEGGALHRRDGLVQATMIPMGFTKIHRSVIEELARQLDATPQEAPTRFHETDSTGMTGLYRGFFNSGIGPDQQWWGEDHAFCQNLLALGYEIWVDPDVDFTHRGNKRWKGNLLASLPAFEARAQLAFEDQQKQADKAEAQASDAA